MGKITEYGYVRDTLQDITTKLKSDVKTKMGVEWTSDTGKVLDQFLSIFAEQLDQVEQGIEGVIESQKVSGAEGIYLDDMLNRQGVYRQGQSAGTGDAIIFANKAVTPSGFTIPLTSTVSAKNSITYNITSTNTYDNYINCYKLSPNQIVVGTPYTFQVYNSYFPNTRVFQWTPLSDTDKDTMLKGLAQYMNDNITQRKGNAYYNPTDRTLYLGFNQSTGIPEVYDNGELYVGVTPSIGSVGIKVRLEAATKGFYPVEVGDLLSVNPTFAGYTSPILNSTPFESGSEVQTDSEFLLNANKQKQNSLAGTEDALINGLLDIEGVVDVRIYQNPTSGFMYDAANRTVCQPFTYNCVVTGGDDNLIAQTIFKKGYGNTKTFGTRTANAVNVKNEVVPIKFSKTTNFNIATDIKVTTKEGTPLNETEKANITNNLIRIVSEIEIGGNINVDLLKSVVLQSVQFGRIRQIQIQIKDLTLINANFTTDDLVAEYDEKPVLVISDITYGRI